MINFISTWAEQIIIAVVVSSIIEMILPDNKNKKYVKMVIGIYVLFTIISPIVGKKKVVDLDDLNLESYAVTETDTKKEVNQESMDIRLQQLYIEELEKNIKTKVEQEGYTVNSCKVDAILAGNEEKQGINKITLILTKNDEKIENKDNYDQKSDVQDIKKVEINVGLERILENKEGDSNNKENNSEIQKLKDTLASYYEIDNKKISITFK